MKTKYDIGDEVAVLAKIKEIHVHDNGKIEYRMVTNTHNHLCRDECERIQQYEDEILDKANKG